MGSLVFIGALGSFDFALALDLAFGSGSIAKTGSVASGVVIAGGAGGGLAEGVPKSEGIGLFAIRSGTSGTSGTSGRSGRSLRTKGASDCSLNILGSASVACEPENCESRSNNPDCD